MEKRTFRVIVPFRASAQAIREFRVVAADEREALDAAIGTANREQQRAPSRGTPVPQLFAWEAATAVADP